MYDYTFRNKVKDLHNTVVNRDGVWYVCLEYYRVAIEHFDISDNLRQHLLRLVDERLESDNHTPSSRVHKDLIGLKAEKIIKFKTHINGQGPYP